MKTTTRRVLPIVLILAILMAGGVWLSQEIGRSTSGDSIYLASSPQYKAEALIRISAMQHSLLGEQQQNFCPDVYDLLVHTQMSMLRTPAVIDNALRNPDLGGLPIWRQQRDRRAWLTNELQIERRPRTEIVSVSITMDSADAAEKIVNAVVNAYFEHIHTAHRQSETSLLAELRTEQRRHLTIAGTLRGSIISLTEEVTRLGAPVGADGMVAGLAQGEALLQQLSVADAQLVVLQARRTAIEERIRDPSHIPVVVLIQGSPEFVALNTQRERALQELSELEREVFDPETDPRVEKTRQDLAELERRMADFANAGLDRTSGMVDAILFQERLTLWGVEQEIRQQQHLVRELRERYEAQLADSAERSEKAMRIAFLRTELNRTDNLLDAIETRIQSILAESRAPSRIVLISKAVVSEMNTENGEKLNLFQDDF